MRNRLLILLTAAMLMIGTGCAAISTLDASPSVLTEADLDSKPYVGIQMKHMNIGDNWFNVRLRFSEQTKYNCLVQEIQFKRKRWGSSVMKEFTLVEVFGFYDRETLVDYHRSSFIDETEREMFLYPATVIGVDWRNDIKKDFGHLPQNEDGSVVTNAPTYLNRSYQANNKTQGVIIESAKHLGVRWSIKFKKGKMTVRLPNRLEYTVSYRRIPR